MGFSPFRRCVSLPSFKVHFLLANAISPYIPSPSFAHAAPAQCHIKAPTKATANPIMAIFLPLAPVNVLAPPVKVAGGGPVVEYNGLPMTPVPVADGARVRWSCMRWAGPRWCRWARRSWLERRCPEGCWWRHRWWWRSAGWRSPRRCRGWACEWRSTSRWRWRWWWLRRRALARLPAGGRWRAREEGGWRGRGGDVVGALQRCERRLCRSWCDDL